MRGNILVLDCDGVIFDSIPLIDKYVQVIKYEASDAYKQELDVQELKVRFMKNKWEEERSDNPEVSGLIKKKLRDVSKKRKEHYEYKDQVLEEALPEYRDLIDYESVYKLENTFEGVINMIYTIYGKGLFDEIIVLSHVNSDGEISAKKLFFKNYLPMVKFVPVMFHLEPFYNSDGSKNVKRLRTNKMGYYKKISGKEDLSNVYFIDDTESIVCEAKELGVTNSYYKNDSLSTVDLLTKACFDAMGVVDYVNKNK